MQKKITIRDLIQNEDYDYISLRVTLPERIGGGDTFFGVAASKNGKLISLDGDSYSDEIEVLKYKEWTKPEKGVKNGLTIVYEGEWMGD